MLMAMSPFFSCTIENSAAWVAEERERARVKAEPRTMARLNLNMISQSKTSLTLNIKKHKQLELHSIVKLTLDEGPALKLIAVP